MVRTARFAFDNPRGPDHLRLDDPFDEDNDPLYEAPFSAGDELPTAQTRDERPRSNGSRKKPGSRPDEGNRLSPGD